MGRCVDGVGKSKVEDRARRGERVIPCLQKARAARGFPAAAAGGLVTRG